MAYFCNGKKGICPKYEMDACGDCEYYDGSGGHKTEFMTNADYLRSMADEELAGLLYEADSREGSSSLDSWFDWLQQPYKEET